MENLISALQVRTALPFGYLVFGIFWLILTFWAVKNIIQLCWKRSFGSIKLYLALGLLVFNSSCIYANILFDQNLDLNPSFSESDILGLWRDGNSSFYLLKDRTASLNFDHEHKRRFGLLKLKAQWQRQGDFEIFIGAGQKTTRFRIVRLFDTYRAIPNYPDDPDMWDGDLGFEHLGTSQKNTG